MALVRPLSQVDVLFVLAVAGLATASIAVRVGRDDIGRLVGVAGWLGFVLFWASTAAGYVGDGRFFLGTIGLLTVFLAAYGALLVTRRRPEGWRLTTAFAVMGLVFVPYEWVEPIHRLAIDGVAALTAAGLERAGFDPIVLAGPEGYANVLAFSGAPLSHAISIVSACTGISAIALFVGLVAAADGPPRRRFAAALTVAAVVFGLNLVRTVFVASALAGEWFGALAPAVGPVYGVSDPALVSYYVAEYVLAQLLVVLALVLVYALLVRAVPTLGDLVEGVVRAARTDLRRLT